MQVTAAQVISTAHNFLPCKIATNLATQPSQKPGQLVMTSQSSVGRLYQSVVKEGSEPVTAGSIGANQTGPVQPKVTAQKSPGKTFKNGKSTASATQISTLIGSGVRKQQFAKI